LTLLPIHFGLVASHFSFPISKMRMISSLLPKGYLISACDVTDLKIITMVIYQD